MGRLGAVVTTCVVFAMGCGGTEGGDPTGGQGGTIVSPVGGATGSGAGGSGNAGVGGMAGPMCRGAAETCALTTDCCSGLICQGNHCVTPALCRPQSGTCEMTTDCCSGLICQGNVCSPPPTCGDGTCSPGETQTNCCADCGCLSGAYCSIATGTCLAASVVMSWRLADACFDGLAIQYRFFDRVNGVVWPATLSNTFQSTADGQTVNTQIACIPGSQICYGAEPNPTNGTTYWGVGLSGAQACSACCALCGILDPQISLVCQ
jgi:hypothetical protein